MKIGSRRRSAIRPADARENPGLVLAVLALGVVLPFAPPTVAPARPPAAPLPAVAAVLPAPPPRQTVVNVDPRPVVLQDQPTGGRTVALTFDDGPDPRWTPQVLAALRRHGAVATFCVITDNVRAHPDLVRDVVDAGMRLCDHTRTHPADLTVLPRPQLETEVVGARADLAAEIDAPVAYFRAPGGHFSTPVLDLAAGHGMQPLGWSIDPRDWEQPGVAAIVATLQRDVRPGSVILLHDGGGHRRQTVDALEVVLPWLAAHGYRCTFPTP